MHGLKAVSDFYILPRCTFGENNHSAGNISRCEEMNHAENGTRRLVEKRGVWIIPRLSFKANFKRN
jgi:hypothetical protein